MASMLSLATVAVPHSTLHPTRSNVVHSVPHHVHSAHPTHPVHLTHPVRSTHPTPSTHSELKHQAISRSKPVHKPRPNWIPMIATWYDGQEGINGTGTGITKSGAHVVSGVTIAVDPRVIPLGSHVLVKFSNGVVRTYIAEDTGSDIIGDHIDIYNPSRQQCLKDGVQHVWVEVEN